MTAGVPGARGRIAVCAAVLALAVLALPEQARADGAQPAAFDAGADDTELMGSDFNDQVVELAKALGKRVFGRARRSLALGPYLGVAPGLAFGDEVEGDFSVSFGLGLYRYKIPLLPSAKQIQDIVKNRFLALLKEKLKAYATTGAEPSKQDMDRFRRETWEQIRAELLLELRPKRFEKPGMMAALEADYLFSAEAWDVRVLFGIGLGPVFASLGLNGHIDSSVDLVIPVELSVPMLLSDGLRAPTVHFFLRGDIAATGRDAVPDRVFLGARIALDII